MSYQQLLDELQTYEDEYQEFRQLFESDGEVDPSEQAYLDQIEIMISQIRQSLTQQAEANGEGMCVAPRVPGLDAAALTVGECRTDDPVQNPITDRDWTHLKTNFVQAVQIWCNSMQHVVNQFEKDLGKSDDDSEDIALAAAVLKVVVGEILPKNVKLALDVAEPILNRVINDLQSGDVSLRGFCELWDGTFHEFTTDAKAHEEMFANFRRNVGNKCGSSLSLEAVNREISYLANQLPQREAVRKLLLKAWINSTKDEGWFIDEIGNVAGYFKVDMWQSSNGWDLKECYLDDTDEQPGVIAMLQKEYPNTPLHELPFMMRVYLRHGLGLKYFTFAEKAKNGGWTVKRGNQDVFAGWQKSGKDPTTADLKKERLV